MLYIMFQKKKFGHFTAEIFCVQNDYSAYAASKNRFSRFSIKIASKSKMTKTNRFENVQNDYS